MVIQTEVGDSPHLGVLVFSKVGVPVLVFVGHIVDVTVLAICIHHQCAVALSLLFILGSISPIFYEQLIHMKVFLCIFYVLTMWVCNFLAKGFWHKRCS
jgi:hypothetical protein